MRRLRLIRQEMMDRLWETKFPRGFKEHGKKSFIEHHDMVRRLVPKENLLEYSVKEGWEPLCKFLGEPVPDEPFPCLNDRASFWTGMVKAFGYEFTQPS